MKTVNIHEAKTHLSRLVERAAKGEGFIIARAGKPLVKVVPLEYRRVLAEMQAEKGRPSSPGPSLPVVHAGK